MGFLGFRLDTADDTIPTRQKGSEPFLVSFARWNARFPSRHSSGWRATWHFIFHCVALGFVFYVSCLTPFQTKFPFHPIGFRLSCVAGRLCRTANGSAFPRYPTARGQMLPGRF